MEPSGQPVNKKLRGRARLRKLGLNLLPLSPKCFAGQPTSYVAAEAVAERMTTFGLAPLVVFVLTTMESYAFGHLKNALLIPIEKVGKCVRSFTDFVHPTHLPHLTVVERLVARMPPTSRGDLPPVIVVVSADTPPQLVHDLCAAVKLFFSRPVGLLCDGVAAIPRIYPRLVTRDPPSYAYYAGLAKIRDGLYLGDRFHARDHRLFKDAQIAAVVNCTEHLPNTFEGDGVRYLQVPLDDLPSANIYEHFGEIIAFIESAISSGCNVLVHCHAGISRSATAVIAYLMQSEGMTYEEALDDVRSRRPIVSPNLGFSQQLREFETQLRDGVPVEVPPPPPPSPATPPATSPEAPPFE